MSTQYAFGKIVTDGLVLSLDAADKNSYVGSGTTFNDLSNNNNTGTIVNTPTFNTSNGGFFTFNGSTNYVTGSVSSLSVSSYTLSVWAYPVSKSAGASPLSLSGSGLCYLQIGGPANYPWQFNGAFANTAPTLNVWTHVVGVQTATTQFLYINGSLAKTFTLTSTIGNQYSVGVRTDATAGTYFSGSVAIAQVYNRALSQNEIQQNYNAQKGRFGLT